MESDLDSSTVRAAQDCAAKLPDHLRNRTYFNLVPYRIILSVPFALDDATNNRLTYYMPSSASESAGARPTFSTNTTPSGELLANVAQQLDMLTGNALLDWGLLSGLLRAVGRRLRSENWMGHAPAWYDWDQQLQVVKEADALVRAGQDARGTIHLPNAARYRLPLSSMHPPAGVGLAVERDCVPGSYAPVPPYMQQEALRALGGRELPGTIGGLLQALRKMDRSAFALGI